MSIITTPPQGVIGKGIYYPVRTDFTVWLEFARLIESKDSARAALRALDLCYVAKRPDNFLEAIELLCTFFLGSNTAKTNSSGEQVISFTKDEELIYASFLSEYGIDLSKEKLHWWRFLALLRALGPDTALMRVVAVRAAKPSDIKNPALRRQLLRRKRIYSLGENNADAGEVIAQLFEAEREVENGGRNNKI